MTCSFSPSFPTFFSTEVAGIRSGEASFACGSQRAKHLTTSFGFAKMTNEERLNFLDYTFLDFEGTVMCQKLLRKIPSTDLRLIISKDCVSD